MILVGNNLRSWRFSRLPKDYGNSYKLLLYDKRRSSSECKLPNDYGKFSKQLYDKLAYLNFNKLPIDSGNLVILLLSATKTSSSTNDPNHSGISAISFF